MKNHEKWNANGANPRVIKAPWKLPEFFVVPVGQHTRVLLHHIIKTGYIVNPKRRANKENFS
jgi:hypothetical protein